MKPCKPGAYARISEDPLGHGLGVGRQREDLEALAARLGWGQPQHYTENDTSASKGKRRPVFESLLADYEAGKIDGILVYSLDRLTRRMSELVWIVDWVTRTGCPVVTCEGDDFLTANGRMVIHMKGAVAQNEASRISERTARALLAKARKGEKPTGGRIYGYDDQMKIVPEEAERIRAWAKVVLGGGSIASIARSLNEAGVPTPRGAKCWFATTVRRILLRATIAGYIEYTYEDADTRQKVTEMFRANWDPIITLGQREALTEVLSGRRGVGEHRARRYLLSGIVTCGQCGAAMYGADPSEGGWRYRCRPQWGGCGRVTRSGARVDMLVTLAVLEMLRLAGPLKPPQPVTDEAEQALEAVGDRIERLRSEYAKGEVGDADYFGTLRALREAEKSATRKLKAAEKQKAEREAQAHFTADDWESCSLEQKRQIVRSILAQIVLMPSKAGKFDPGSVWFRGHGAEHMLTFAVGQQGDAMAVEFVKAA